MKILVEIRNESGFGLIHVLAVTLIVSIAVLGLFISVEYARSQADKNCHTRRALLLGQGYLEEIKYDHRNYGLYKRPQISSQLVSHKLDSRSGNNINATVNVSSSVGGNPESVTGLLRTFKDQARVKVVWKERPTTNMTDVSNKECSVYLVEDYYWKRSGVSVN